MVRQRLCRSDALQDGAMQRFDGPNGLAIALYRVEGRYYATADICSHGQSSLTDEGELDGYAIECGRHFGRFDIRTGAVLASPCTRAIAAFAVIEDNGELFVELPDE